MGVSSLGARKFAATSQVACELLRDASVARRAPHDGRAARSCRARVLCLSLPTVVGWRVGSPATHGKVGVCGGGSCVGQCLCGCWVRVGGRCVALAPDGAVGVGSVGGARLGLAVRGWVTWRDLPAGQWIGLGSGRGLGTAAPPPNGLCRGSGAASAGTMASAAQCMGDPGRAEAGDGRVARARGAGRGHPWRRPAP